MPSTHVSLHYHLIFSTKERYPLIAPEWRGRLHAFLGGEVRTLKGHPTEIGGMADHVHLLIGLRATHCLADVMRDVKAGSSKWVHDEIGLAAFNWQEGYGAFTVGPTQIDSVRRYIQNQEIHHQHTSFQQEYLEFLKLGGVEYDERYLW